MNKHYVLGSLIALVVSFAAGRYSVPQEDIKSSVVSKTDDVKHENVNTKTHQVIVAQPNGNTITTTDTTTLTKVEEDDKTVSVAKTTITDIRKTLSVSGLMSYNYWIPGGLDYGLSVSKEVLGPVTIGVWGMKSGVFGMSLGVNF